MPNRRKTACWIIAFCAILFGCDPTLSASSSDRVFSFTAMNEVSFDLDLLGGDFVWLAGHGIADGDYRIDAATLVFEAAYLATLAPGDYDFELVATTGTVIVTITVADEHNPYRVENGGFETGDLSGWTAETVFKGESALLAFVDAAVVANGAVPTLPVPFAGDGDFVYGFTGTPNADVWNEKMGILKSSAFVLGGIGWITFKLGAGENIDLAYVSVRDTDTDEEVARFGNTAFHAGDYLTDPETTHEADLVLYKADLSAHLGETLYLELVDMGGRSWDFLTGDAFETYHETIPAEGLAAIDLRPQFSAAYVTNQIPNGDFAAGLDGWTVSTAAGWSTGAFAATGNVLRSNQGGDAATGMIRSSLFRVDGSGIVSVELAAGRGLRFDKDTYVSIRQAGTNRELFRFANVRANGTAPIVYYIDLSMYLGTNCYFEIVDNASAAWDTIFVSNVVTYYPETPDYDFGQAGEDLGS